VQDLILALDQGTTSTRALAVNRDLKPIAIAQSMLPQSYPQPGWVEHDAEEIWRATLEVAGGVIAQAGGPDRFAAIAITNQRETVVAWDAETSEVFGPAIVWQDRRTASTCSELAAQGKEPAFQAATGLLLDPYFSGSKIGWMLENRPEAAAAAQRGTLRVGTIDCFLIWRLTGGKVHATDATNASRTALFGLASQQWENDLCALFGVPMVALPTVKNGIDDYGATPASLFGRPVPIRAVAGDQQAALVGQGCLSPGLAKVTFGTGAFLVANTGDAPIASSHRLLGTVGYRLGGKVAYALEGSIFNAGTVVQWLRDELGFFAQSADIEALAASVPDAGGVVVVPAFTGLGAPHWLADARGSISGITRGTTKAHIARAALDSVALQTADLLTALEADGAPTLAALRVDGGMAANATFLQRLADLCGVPVERPSETEMTALGVASLAAIDQGWIAGLEALGARWKADARFEPKGDRQELERAREGWALGLAATRAAIPA